VVEICCCFNQAVAEKKLRTCRVAFFRYFLKSSMVEIAMKRANKGFLRHFGDTEKARLFNNECDVHCAFDHPDHI